MNFSIHRILVYHDHHITYFVYHRNVYSSISIHCINVLFLDLLQPSFDFFHDIFDNKIFVVYFWLQILFYNIHISFCAFILSIWFLHLGKFKTCSIGQPFFNLQSIISQVKPVIFAHCPIVFV